MKTYKIKNGAERNCGHGYILSIQTVYGDSMFIAGIPDDARIMFYKVESETGERYDISDVEAGDLRAKLAAAAFSEEDDSGL